jgi:hypothetical protein
VPEDTPDTVPVVPEDTTVATPVLTLVQVPPLVASVNIVVPLWHTVNVPDIGAGFGLTVTVVVRVQPEAEV